MSNKSPGFRQYQIPNTNIYIPGWLINHRGEAVDEAISASMNALVAANKNRNIIDQSSLNPNPDYTNTLLSISTVEVDDPLAVGDVSKKLQNEFRYIKIDDNYINKESVDDDKQNLWSTVSKARKYLEIALLEKIINPEYDPTVTGSSLYINNPSKAPEFTVLSTSEYVDAKKADGTSIQDGADAALRKLNLNYSKIDERYFADIINADIYSSIDDDDLKIPAGEYTLPQRHISYHTTFEEFLLDELGFESFASLVANIEDTEVDIEEYEIKLDINLQNNTDKYDITDVAIKQLSIDTTNKDIKFSYTQTEGGEATEIKISMFGSQNLFYDDATTQPLKNYIFNINNEIDLDSIDNLIVNCFIRRIIQLYSNFTAKSEDESSSESN